MWVTMSPRLSNGDGAHRRIRLANVDHLEIEGSGRFLRAPQRFQILGVGHVFRQPRLDADDNVAMARNRPLRQGDVGDVHVVQLAARRDDANPGNVHQGAAHLGSCPRDGGDLVDVVRAGRAGIDPTSHTVLQE